ncbi:LptF/LptG family permease [Hyphobacterium sp.]|uniref:LptF/LptG family permease n=1 Tax=Hyphobacterium sp. TaxID=2004662 RepID=UPI003BAC5DE1
MNLVQRYMFRQLLVPFVTAATAFAALALLTQSLSNIEFISNYRETAVTFIKVTLLALPQLIALLSPFALFIAVLAGLSRLYSDSEATVASASGLSRWGVLSPVLRLAALAALLNLVVNLFVQPLAYQEMRRSVFELRTDVAASLVRPGEFSNLATGVTLYARTSDGQGRMSDIFIHDARDPDEVSTYAAREGVIVRGIERPSMVMIDGNIQQVDETGSLNFLTFDRYEFDLGDFVDPQLIFFLKESDLFLHELFFPDAQALARARGVERLLAEAHYRLSAPLYNIALAMIAAAAYMAGAHSRLGNSRRVVAAVAIALAIRLSGFAVQSAAADDTGWNIVQYALPILTIIGAAGVIWGWRRLPRLRLGQTQDAAA